jgi:hypothetical protein
MAPSVSTLTKRPRLAKGTAGFKVASGTRAPRRIAGGLPSNTPLIPLAHRQENLPRAWTYRSYRGDVP